MLLSKLSCRWAGGSVWSLLSHRPRCGRVGSCVCDGALEGDAFAVLWLYRFIRCVMVLLGEHDKTSNFNFMPLLCHSWTKACKDLWNFYSHIWALLCWICNNFCWTLFMHEIILYGPLVMHLLWTVHVLNPGHVASTYRDYRIWCHFKWMSCRLWESPDVG